MRIKPVCEQIGATPAINTRALLSLIGQYDKNKEHCLAFARIKDKIKAIPQQSLTKQKIPIDNAKFLIPR
ncbi:hypothetical protein ELY21_02925 [Legionella sp. km535]|uniref:hypothetical protein n=1 Tax=Legionella sp. km535 TaxID=2498107 RepID=UPI000F8C635F|nr:hypothetical protein [Legionella sp. km535]RUR20019.1 hypothetical protein ELY21_02925 [Legionella sp. km535]